jgi:4-hydroxybenzoate polyprenyltransferase
MFLVGNLVVAFVSALVPLLVSITNADYLRSLYQESLAYTPIVGQLYLWLGAFAAFAFLLTLAREMVKDIEDIDGDCEMECRTAPIVWGVKKTKVLISIILLLTAVFIIYIACYALPFPMEWKSLPMRFVVFGLLVPIVCAIVLLFAANSRQEYQRTQHVLKFIMFLGTMFSYVIYTNLMA